MHVRFACPLLVTLGGFRLGSFFGAFLRLQGGNHHIGGLLDLFAEQTGESRFLQHLLHPPAVEKEHHKHEENQCDIEQAAEGPSFFCHTPTLFIGNPADRIYLTVLEKAFIVSTK